ncbi:MAG: hypothetical protein QNJ46_28535 [Leptolyngbyaceae cyanobacterium MO_188.B28]|nr:hypothetical protein [Leptolyngbyaceae cyanobacterium MO_188.B28]
MTNSQLNNLSKQEFDLLYETLCEIQEDLADGTAKVAGFLLLATGWFATSKNAQDFLESDKVAGYLAIAALAGTFIFYVCASMKIFLISKHTFLLLKQLHFMPTKYYESRRVDVATIAIFVVGNFVLAVLAGCLTWRLI